MYNLDGQNKVTRKEFDKTLSTLPKKTRDFLWEKYLQSFTSQPTNDDMSAECTMCGKPIHYRFCGMCTRCEQVWNG